VTATDEVVQHAFEALLIEARAKGARPPTVASIAARANISRSSMYRFHSDVVSQIQALGAPTRAVRQGAQNAKMRLLAQQLRAERDLTKALGRACAELAAEKIRLAEQLEEERLRFTLRLEALQKKLRGTKHVRLLRPS